MAKVYVLGAGASKAVIPEAPLNDQLLSSILRLRPDDRINLVKQFLLDFFELEPITDLGASRRLPPLEDILSQLDSCLLDNRPLSSSYPLSVLIELREALVYGICRVLKQSLRSGELRLMTKFISNLAPGEAIISLNYDLIVDNSLPHKFKTADYVFPIRYIRKSHILYDNRQDVGNRQDMYVKLYKLHGSLNWLYCPACRAVDLTRGGKGAVYIFQNKEIANCPVCQVRYDPMIITPTYLKNYDNHYIGRVWVAAEESLQQADEIVFIGYSLPDADIVLRTMFARSVYRNRTLNAQSPRITVVDYNEQQENPTRDRYERLFGSINYTNEGFKHYVQYMVSRK